MPLPVTVISAAATEAKHIVDDAKAKTKRIFDKIYKAEKEREEAEAALNECKCPPFLVEEQGKHYSWCKSEGANMAKKKNKTTTAPKTTTTAVSKPDPNILRCYFEERGVGLWWFGVEDKHGDNEHPFDHYGTFPTFGDAYEAMHRNFMGVKPGVVTFEIYPQAESPDDSWKPFEDYKKGFVK